MSHRANPLPGCLEKLWTVFADFQQCLTQGNYDLEHFRKSVLDAFESFERHAVERLIENEHIHKTKYALAAFIDEWVIRSCMNQTGSWLSYPLQLELFADSDAGEQFFKQLSELRLQAENNIDVLEIVYLCLELGYEGHYRLSDKSVLIRLKAELLQQIQQVRKTSDLTLYRVKDYQEDLPISSNRQSVLKKTGIIASALIFVMSVSLWITMSVKSSHYRNHLLQRVTDSKL